MLNQTDSVVAVMLLVYGGNRLIGHLQLFQTVQRSMASTYRHDKFVGSLKKPTYFVSLCRKFHSSKKSRVFQLLPKNYFHFSVRKMFTFFFIEIENSVKKENLIFFSIYLYEKCAYHIGFHIQNKPEMIHEHFFSIHQNVGTAVASKID